VLIVKVSALGDVVHALPVLSWLKSADPQMEIDWLVEESFAPLLDGHPLVRRVHRLATKAWRRQGWGASLRGTLATVGSLRSERYDAVLDLQGNSKSGFFTLLCGAPRRYGFARGGVREWPNLLATNRKVRLSDADHHITERSLAVARAAFAGGHAPSAGPLPVDPAVREAVEARLRESGADCEPLAVLHYGTTWTTKLWPLEYWRELAPRLRGAFGLRPVLTWGSDAELAAARAIAETCAGEALIWPRGALPELVALLARADLVIGADTGPVHIAAAVGTPTVSLYRVTDGRRNGPRGEKHIHLQAPLDCSPCLRKDCSRDAECGRSIPVARVLEAVAALLPREGS
jgi:heptosyltransferase-1